MEISEKYGVSPAGKNSDHSGGHQAAILAYKAAVTNDSVKLLGDIKINMSPEARRWRDLWNHYASRLGNRVNGENVRVRLLALIDLTMELERMTPGIVAGEQGKLVRKSGRPRDFGGQTFVYERGDPHTVIHLSAQILGLLKSLGLDKDGNDNGKQNGKKEQEVNNNVD